MTNDVIPSGEDGGDLAPRNFAELLEFANMVATSGIAPKDYNGKPEACLVAMQFGHEVGLKPMQSLQNIAVIGNRPTLWGDAVLALVTASPHCKEVIEYYENEGTEDMTAVCIAQRHGKVDKIGRFSIAEAKQAGLFGKDTWAKYPKRMLQMRARGFALRDQFPDVLKGLPIAELVREAIEMGQVEQVDPATGEVIGKPNGTSAASRDPKDTVKAKLRKVTLAQVIKAIDEALNADALKAAGELAKSLTSEDDKRKAAEHWQAKIAAERGKGDKKKEGTKDAAKGEPPTVNYAEVASAMDAAEQRGDRDALAAAADLIAQVMDEGQRKELTVLFEAAMHRLDDSEAAS